MLSLSLKMFIDDDNYFCMYVSVFHAVYGIQHYLSIIGSLILTPLVIAPAMGASHVSSHFSFSTILVMFLFLANIFCEYYSVI